MKKDFPSSRFNEANAKKAFAAVAECDDFDIIRWALLKRYTEIRTLLSFTDPNVVSRAVGKMEELEHVLELFGSSLYDGLPLADGTPNAETMDADEFLDTKIGGDYPRGTGS